MVGEEELKLTESKIKENIFIILNEHFIMYELLDQQLIFF